MKRPPKIYALLMCLGLALNLSSCSEDTTLDSDPFVVAFGSISKNLTDMQRTNDNAIPLIYSEEAIENGTLRIQIEAKNAIYGTDFTTIPEAENNQINLQINAGDSENAIQFKTLNSSLDETTEIKFSISNIEYTASRIQGYSTFTINSSAAQGGSLSPQVGGPNQKNQVYIDLSSQSETTAPRDSWDLGFYNGNRFRVTINGSIYMATKALEATDIDKVTEADIKTMQREVAVGTFNPDNAAYVDAPNGDILETAIAEISENDNENPVYLVNLGYEVGAEEATVGSTTIAGNARGWKKIRILRQNDGYLLQYANVNETTHQEISISKNANYNFNHFSFNTNTIVSVEPEKDKWDLCFTVFTNILEDAGSYGFSDYVIHNNKSDVTAYKVEATNLSYDDFNLSHVNSSLFSKDQTAIGSNWRDVFERTVFADKFYILKDANGNIYKIKFLAMTNSNGDRGYPEFEYNLLQ
ncbi:HmuY family protein [Pseudotamlana agarivorans]|uniref:HmuY family protein n=1 Tax=Pseudotamlana agarivorans TaxID=481183 RepID=UPI00082AD8C0|nr:HmuY family protein [Tamlana agarivorans]